MPRSYIVCGAIDIDVFLYSRRDPPLRCAHPYVFLQIQLVTKHRDNASQTDMESTLPGGHQSLSEIHIRR